MYDISLYDNYTLNSADYSGYYIDSNGGDDNNNGLTPKTAWKTLARANSAPYPSVKRLNLAANSVFTDVLEPDWTGNVIEKYVITCYGIGDKPIISGFNEVAPNDWSLHSGNVYKATISPESDINIMMLDGVNTEMARTEGFSTIDEVNKSLSYITCDDYDSNVKSYQGAEIVVKVKRFIFEKKTINQHVGNKFYIGFSSDEPSVGWGFFIQKDLSLLQKHGDWYYDGVSTLYMYFDDTPGNHTVKYSSREYLVHLNGRSYVDFENIEFEGASKYCIKCSNSTEIKISNCYFHDVGDTPIFIYGPNAQAGGISLYGNTIKTTNSCGVFVKGDYDYVNVKFNTVSDIGLLEGMLPNRFGQTHGVGNGMHIGSENSLVSYNDVKRVGYDGIVFGYSNSICAYNTIDQFNIILDDGGGIYTIASNYNDYSGMKIHNNIISNGYGTTAGHTSSSGHTGGIYTDGYSSNIDIYNNIVSKCKMGIFMHHAAYLNIYENYLYDNIWGLRFEHTSDHIGDMADVDIYKNFIFAFEDDQYCFTYRREDNDFYSFGDMYANTFVKYGNADIIFLRVDYGSYNYKTLSEWQTESVKDSDSVYYDKKISDFFIRVNKSINSSFYYSNEMLLDGDKYLKKHEILSHSFKVLLRK